MYRTASIVRGFAVAFAILVTPLPGAAQFLVAADPGGDRLTFVDPVAGVVAGSLATGAGPFGVAVSPDGSLVVVAGGGGEVEVIEAATGLRSVVSLGGAPAAVAIDPAGGRAFVADAAGATLAILDLATRTLLASVPVGASPVAVAADGSRVYTADFAADTLTVIDAASGTVEATVAVGGFPAGVAADPAGGRVWVANYFEDTVSVVDPTAATVVATVPVGADPRAIAFDPVGGRVFVASTTAGTVTVLDAVTHAVLATAGTGGLNPVGLVVTPAGDRLYVLHLASAELTVLDTASLTVVGTVPLPLGHLSLAGFAIGLPTVASAVEIPTLGGWGMLFLVGLLTLVALRKIRRGSGWAGIAGLALVLLGGAPAPATAAPGTFQIVDGTFVDADWEVFAANVGGGSQTAMQMTPGGNPDFFRVMNHFGDLIEVTHRFVGTGATYDPATRGAISSLDFAWDREFLALDPGPAELEEAPVVIQGKQAFLAAPDLFQTNSLLVWEPFVVTGLTAADFDDGSGGNPDFSAAGSALTFGYLRRTGLDGATGFFTHGLDNFRVTVAGGGGGGGEAGVLRFEFPSYVAIDGQAAVLGVQRVGGTAGAVSATVTIPLAFGGAATETVSWANGDGGDKPVAVPATGIVPFAGGIGSSEATLGAVTGGALIHPSRGKTLLLVAPDGTGPLGILAVLLLVLLGASTPWLSAALVVAALYALWWRGRRKSTGRAAASPPSAP